MYYLYILKSINFDQIYIGSTNNLRVRLSQHNSGEVFSTKRYMPWELFYYEAYKIEKLARMREKNLKYNGNGMRELKKRIGLSKSPKSGAGFTLIELIVVIFIMLMLSTIGIANFRAGERNQRVRIGVETAIAALRRAQTLTLSGRIIDDSGCGLGKAPVAYLVYFKPSTGIDLYGVDKCNEAVLVETYQYPVNTFVPENGYTLDSTAASTLQIKFTTPYAEVTAVGDSLPNTGTFAPFSEATAMLTSSDGGITKILNMNGVSGRIGE